MKHSTSRILTTHTGSLVRPPEVIAAVRDKTLGRPYDAATETTLSQAVTEVVARQAALGIDVPDDGEYGKSGFATYISDRLAGFSEVDGVVNPAQRGRDRNLFPEAYAELDGTATGAGTGSGPQLSGGIPRTRRDLACTGPVRYVGQEVLAQDLDRLHAAARAAGVDEVFCPSTAPGTIALQRPNLYYGSDEEYLAAVADAMAVEYRAVVDSGAVLQIDDPRAVTAYDAFDSPPDPAEYRRFLQVRVDALNHALRDVPADRVRYHVCWGSWHGPHTTDIELRHIIDTVLTIDARAFVLEAGNVRHAHEYRVFEEVALPADTVVVPGVVSHTTNLVEHPELVAERICDYAALVGRERVMAGTDCGFAQGFAHKKVHESIQWAKLESLVEGARLASARLWR